LRPLQVIRKHLEEHLGKEMAYHMILLKKSFDSCTKNMKEEFETVLKVVRPLTLRGCREINEFPLRHTQMKDDRIRQLEKALRITGADFASSSSSVPLLNGSLVYTRVDTKVVWKIKNFSSVRKKSYLQSDKFSFADFNWCVPRGAAHADVALRDAVLLNDH